MFFQDPAEADKLLKIQRDLDETKIILVSFQLWFCYSCRQILASLSALIVFVEHWQLTDWRSLSALFGFMHVIYNIERRTWLVQVQLSGLVLIAIKIKATITFHKLWKCCSQKCEMQFVNAVGLYESKDWIVVLHSHES